MCILWILDFKYILLLLLLLIISHQLDDIFNKVIFYLGSVKTHILTYFYIHVKGFPAFSNLFDFTLTQRSSNSTAATHIAVLNKDHPY